MSIRSIITTALCLTVLSITAQTAGLPKKNIDGKEFYVYKVAKSEGFYAISHKFKISQEEIIRYNPTAKNGLKRDQILLIPVQAADTKVAGLSQNDVHTFEHTIKRGESLYSISKMYNVSISAILKANPGVTKRIKAGDILRIPQKNRKRVSSETPAPAATIAAETVKTDSVVHTSNSGQDSAEYSFHTVASGETLFAISRQYACSIEDILRSNPGISPDKLYKGSVIRIPAQRLHSDETAIAQVADTVKVTQFVPYKVKKKETLYSIAKKFNLSVDDLKKANPGVKAVKQGKTINIPEQKTEINSRKELVVTDEQIDKIYNRIYEKKNVGHSNVAVILPFMLQHKPDVKSALYTEYYQGFLLAVDSLKRQGFSINVYAYDTEGSVNHVKNLLDKPEMKTMDLIIAPDNDEMIDLIADFGAKYDVNVVNTFSLKNEKVNTNARVFQTNIPHSYLYAETVDRFIRTFRNREVVFISDIEDAAEPHDFADILRDELANQGIPYRTCTYKATLNQSDLLSALGDTTSVVFVPTSNKKEVPDAIVAPLATFVENNPQYAVSLFGYPSWITQINDYLNEFYKLDTYMFSRFYTSSADSRKQDFDMKFHYWYNDEMMNASPQYGLLGFDTGLYFLSAIAQNGKNFANYDLTASSNALQTDFKFERINNWSGFINKSFYFIHFTPYMVIQKTNE